jgi:hypothetical protein
VDHTKRNEQWHDDMHMYGSQLPRRLLFIGITHERTHLNTYTYTHPHTHLHLPSAGGKLFFIGQSLGIAEIASLEFALRPPAMRRG